MRSMVEIEFGRESVQMDAYILVEYNRGSMVAFPGWRSEVGGGGTKAAAAAAVVGILGGRGWEVRRGATVACEVVKKATVECQGSGG